MNTTELWWVIWDAYTGGDERALVQLLRRHRKDLFGVQMPRRLWGEQGRLVLNNVMYLTSFHVPDWTYSQVRDPVIAVLSRLKIHRSSERVALASVRLARLVKGESFVRSKQTVRSLAKEAMRELRAQAPRARHRKLTQKEVHAAINVHLYEADYQRAPTGSVANMVLTGGSSRGGYNDGKKLADNVVIWGNKLGGLLVAARRSRAPTRQDEVIMWSGRPGKKDLKTVGTCRFVKDIVHARGAGS